ncbi:hypothetical protein [Marinomonas gallaica]|uniref:hypothetical protein n=1 Tax=Marinomonas gallaica TaxID=1806667 RepID=UPI00082B7DCE|nr:hypothetical protein [Marinomonas gallaica]
MKTSPLLTVSLAALTVATLSACSIVHNTDSTASSKTLRPHFFEALEQTQWLEDEYQVYLDKTGNKAFAVYWDKQGIPRATGFADDKLSIEIARREALRLCHAYTQNQNTGCRLEDESTTDRAPLNQDNYPKEVIAYRDAAHWDKHQATSGHKAIAGNLSGIQASTQAETQTEAEEQALLACYENTHFSMPTCYILDSQ